MKITLFVSLLLFSLFSQAQDLWIGQPTFGGTGCPAGKTFVSVSPDRQQISMITDDFVVKSGNYSGKVIDRKSCNLAIPVQAPEGYQVALESDTEIYASLGRKAQATISQEIFTSGSRGPIQTRKFTGPIQSGFVFESSPTLAWSQCGQSSNMRVNFSLVTQGNGFAVVDQIHFKFHFRRCR